MPRNRLTPTAASRRATNITGPEPLLEDARALGINISHACECGLATVVAEQHGLPLAAYRQF